MYQWVGNKWQNSFLLDALYEICRFIDPVKVADEYINPAMLQAILNRAGISTERFEELLDEDEAD